MKEPRCDRCGKSLEYETKAHPGIGIASAYLKNRGRNYLRVLHDSLLDSGHGHLAAYLRHAEAYGRRPHLHQAAHDVRQALRQEGTVAPLSWKEEGPRRGFYAALAGHGRYEHGFHSRNGYTTSHSLRYVPHVGDAAELGAWEFLPGSVVTARHAALAHHRQTVHAFPEEE